ncbi:hypothetical protein IAG44_42510 [Streptomyces roseirectus]|uniref:Clp R domain-containing protein n=1 Tax=Streptomyces roseirectus TaxID=2768066 RepID=A0A7H0IRK9_9ACTN|nr:hypothetical protein [Streptomyces roseirectus]QNP75425.1 hypothetical protein IAG44_42510 [Streptomyces roseirectus]
MERETQMEQRGDGMTTEFGVDVVRSLARALKVAVRVDLAAVGTDTVLEDLVGETETGDAVAPGMRKAGSLGGHIRALATGGRWVSADDAEAVEDAEVDAVWREARSLYRSQKPGPAELPGMTGALRACLLHALDAARAEGALAVRERHVARALVERPGTRAREAMTLERIDPAAALERIAALGPDEALKSVGVGMLRMGGAFGRRRNPITRVIGSLASGSGVNGSPVLGAVVSEALRQATRQGREAAGTADLLLGILALDRGLRLYGRALPDDLTTANSAADLLRGLGVREDTLLAAATALPSNPGNTDAAKLTPAAIRVTDVARLRAAEHGAPTTGTVHLLAALLDDKTAVGLLDLDVDALRADLTPLLGA